MFQPMITTSEQKQPQKTSKTAIDSRLRYVIITFTILLASIIFFMATRIIFTDQTHSAPITSFQTATKRTILDDGCKYLGLSYTAASQGGGIGNQLFEFISLIGIARTLNRGFLFSNAELCRIPYVTATNFATIKKLYQLSKSFPNLPHQFRVLFPKVSDRTEHFSATLIMCCQSQ
ncbi:unnamed protein product [Anisakis simplex]|uniref:Uncharacterized protein n=1 Tax=Anisakis simplex TaxID=6269 RepID=A0A0M3JWB9_ANISI|nr:unnamed protein product [Anisakis simplex]